MTKKVRILLISGLGLLLAAGLGIFWYYWPLIEPYNINPDLSEKKDAYYMQDAEPILFTEDYLWHSDAVIVGTVISGYKPISNPYEEGTELSEATKEKGINANNKVGNSIILVEQVLGGALEEDTIELMQRTDDPKIRVGDRVVIPVMKWRDIYRTINSTVGIFYLDDKDRLTSMSSNMTCARYDGLSLRRYAADLKDNYFYDTLGATREEWDLATEQLRYDHEAKIRLLKDRLTFTVNDPKVSMEEIESWLEEEEALLAEEKAAERAAPLP